MINKKDLRIAPHVLFTVTLLLSSIREPFCSSFVYVAV